MIVTKSKFAVHKNGRGGKWRKGYIALSSEVCDTLNWDSKEILVVIAEKDEVIDEAKIKAGLEKYKETLEMEKEIGRMRKEMS